MLNRCRVYSSTQGSNPCLTASSALVALSVTRAGQKRRRSDLSLMSGRRTREDREIALSGFEEAFRAGVLGQQEAYAKGEPQKIMTAFLQKKLK